MFNYKVTYYILLLFCLSGFIFSQEDKQCDSTKKLYFKERNDTVKMSLLSDIAYYYNNLGEYDSAKKYAKLGLQISNKYHKTQAAVKFYSRLGVSCWNQSDYAEALKYYDEAVKVSNNEDDLSGVYNNIGLVYWDKGELPTALKYFLKSYDIDKRLKDEKGMSSSLLNMGLISDGMKDYKSALSYYYKSLSLSKLLNDEKGVGICYNNIGQVFSSLGDNYKAMDFYIKSFKTSSKVNDKSNVAMAGNNIGVLYSEKGKYQEAESYYNEALKLYIITLNLVQIILFLLIFCLIILI